MVNLLGSALLITQTTAVWPAFAVRRTVGWRRAPLGRVLHRGPMKARVVEGCQAYRFYQSSSATFMSIDGSGWDDPVSAVPDLDDDAEHSVNEVESYLDPRINLPRGTSPGFFVVETYKTDPGGFDLDRIRTQVGEDDFRRLRLSPQDVTVPVALMMLDPKKYKSRSQARKACRKGSIVVHRGKLPGDHDPMEVFSSIACFRARVGDRLFPGDVIGKQVRMGGGEHPIVNYPAPPIDLPVVFEDDHLAIVNKPEGVVVYAHKSGGHGTMSVRAALPFAVAPPAPGTYSTLRCPQPVHRLDKPTSGLLVVAKTMPSMVHLSHQFRDRKVKKTYIAAVNGIPTEPSETMISSEAAAMYGLDVDSEGYSGAWQIIKSMLDGKEAVTLWRPLKSAASPLSNSHRLTLLELKPQTGRYHQIRRHMAWDCDCPIVGDVIYDGGGAAMKLRENGLFLCSSSVTLEHPYYNTPEGRAVFEKMELHNSSMTEGLSFSTDGRVMVNVSIDIPEKYGRLMHSADEGL